MNLTKDQIRSIDALVKHWPVAEVILKDDVMRAALGLGSVPNMTEAEMHFRRGAIWAAQNMLSLPSKLKLAADNQRAMESLLIKDDKPR